MCMSLPIRFRLIGKNSIVDMNVICFKDNSKNFVLIAFQYIKDKNIFCVNEHRKLKMNPNKWWKSEVYLERKVPSLIFWNSVSIFSTPDDFILICILNVYTFIILWWPCFSTVRRYSHRYQLLPSSRRLLI
jgi:hypothetical protein